MDISEKQRRTINKAVQLLSRYDKENISDYTYYFRKGEYGDEISSEYDICDSENCMKEMKAVIKKKFKDYKIIEPIFTHNNGDHERIDKCNICFRPLHSSLTWIRDEFDYFFKNVKTKKEFTQSDTAFGIRIVLESMPSADHRFSGYDKHQLSMGNTEPYNKTKQRQKDFVSDVVKYSELIIKKLTPKK